MLSSERVLIAETDPRILNRLSHVVFSHVPSVAMDWCASAETLFRKTQNTSYDTVTISPSDEDGD